MSTSMTWQRMAIRLAATAIMALTLLANDGVTRPAHATAASCSTPYLQTAGTRIADGCGNPVTLHALNWYGFDSNDFVAGGLYTQTYQAIVDHIKSLGYNALRIPFSNEMVERNPVVSDLGSICKGQTCLPLSGATVLGPNSSLVGLHALDILKTIVDYAGQQGLYVILDDHRSEAAWGPEENGLWYTSPSCASAALYTCYDPQSWLTDWQTIATTLISETNVIGMDLRNEPHWVNPTVPSGANRWQPSSCALYVQYAHWGPCNGLNIDSTDWAQAATTAGNMLLGLNPNWLIFVEGGSTYPQDTQGTVYTQDGWGQNLQGVATDPISLSVPNRVVYSPHDYRWYQTNDTAANMQSDWTRTFGFISTPGISYTAPLWVGEFGSCTNNNGCIVSSAPPTGSESGWWLSTFINYMNNPPAPISGPISWSYWPLNGTYSDSWSYSANDWQTCYGQRESYGVLGSDWSTLSSPLLQNTLIPGSVDGSLPPSSWPDFQGPLTAAQCIPSAYQAAHPTPTATPVPPTPIPPTSTPVPPTATSIPPTATPVPPTNTPIPPTATATNTPVPPTATSTNTPVPPTATATARPTATRTPHKPHPSALQLIIHTAQRSVVAGGTLAVRIVTAARAKVTVMIQVIKKTIVVSGRGKHRKRITRTVVLYRTTRQSTVDAHGHLTTNVRIYYRTSRAVQALVSVVARLAHDSATRTAGVTIQPPPRRAR